MFDIRIAELNIRINNKYEYIEKMCSDYIVKGAKPDFEVCASDEDTEKERVSESNPAGYLETLAVYRKIAEKVIDFDGFLMHGAVLDYKETGIAFLAKSGTGKSTHITLWKKMLGDRVTVINGDKPIIRKISGTFHAYGTPWAGKEGWQTNSETELKKICFLERGAENRIVGEDRKNIPGSVLSQIYLPKNNRLYLLKLLDLIGELAETADFYRLWCNMDIKAAETALRGMLK